MVLFPKIGIKWNKCLILAFVLSNFCNANDYPLKQKVPNYNAIVEHISVHYYDTSKIEMKIYEAIGKRFGDIQFMYFDFDLYYMIPKKEWQKLAWQG